MCCLSDISISELKKKSNVHIMFIKEKCVLLISSLTKALLSY